MKYLEKTMKVYKAIILFWTIFIGIGAVVGSMMFFLDPENGFVMGEILPKMQEKLPFSEALFSNFIFSGISLLIVNGLSNLTAAFLIIKNKKTGYVLGFTFGITLMLWICIQFYVFAPEVYFIDILFFIFGLLQFIFGYLAYVNYSQMQFIFDENDYPNVSKVKNKKIVIYFSRMGYTKKKAYEKANELGCEIIEIIPKEKIKGILGFWWCGRFGMHKWPMEIEDIEVDLSSYKEVYLFTPIWVFSISAPMRKFIQDYGHYLKNVHLSLVHFTNTKYLKTVEEVKKVLESELLEIKQYNSHFGIVKEIK